MTEISDQNFYLKDLYKRAKLYARSRGYPELAEDFAQECAMQHARGRKATVTQLFIDMLRTEYGDTGSDCGKLRIGATNPKHSRAIQLDAKAEGSESYNAEYFRIGGDSESEQYAWGAINLVGFISNKTERVIFVLHYIWGFDETEVAYCFGVTLSRISQRLKGIQSRLSERIKKTESGEAQRGPRKVAGLCQEKGKVLEFRACSKMARKESRGLAGNYETSFHSWLT